MKKLLAPIFALSVLAISCDTAPKGDEAKVTEEKTAADSNGVAMNLDTASSTISFTGWGVGKNHPGKFKLNNGTFTMKDGKVNSGAFSVNMNSMTLDEQGEMFQTKLKGHLLSADFFDTQNFPEAKFEITGSEDYTPAAGDTSVVPGANTKISGNLTLKGITKNVTFPAKVESNENGTTTIANFNIDRTQWNMHYNADKESAKDKFIAHDVNISLNISAKKSQ